MLTLGLTGSIGMGKSTTAGLFRDFGVAVHDSDAAVHALYAGADAGLIEAAFPGVMKEGKIDRQALSGRVLSNPAEMQRLEAIVHPYVGRAREDFISQRRAANDRLIVLDIPLLFEIGGDADVDVVVVVTAAADIQRLRVLARPGMTAEKFAQILGRQVSDSIKRQRAHFLVQTDHGVDSARRQVGEILRCLSFIHS